MKGVPVFGEGGRTGVCILGWAKREGEGRGEELDKIVAAPLTSRVEKRGPKKKKRY